MSIGESPLEQMRRYNEIDRERRTRRGLDSYAAMVDAQYRRMMCDWPTVNAKPGDVVTFEFDKVDLSDKPCESCGGPMVECPVCGRLACPVPPRVSEVPDAWEFQHLDDRPIVRCHAKLASATIAQLGLLDKLRQLG